MSLRDEIRSGSILRTADAKFAGRAIKIREFTMDRRFDFARRAGEAGENPEGILALSIATVVYGALDPATGEPLFTDDDAAWLREGGRAVQQLAEAVVRLSGMDGGAAAQATAEGN